ncbi:hypothetical protein Sjap_026662 [Stephania japonica]|uniref:Uncharacterized protein n=1 Tax=Stephania japonica TaxID=461633 RepID=A0AAP0DXW2_9MAGN
MQKDLSEMEIAGPVGFSTNKSMGKRRNNGTNTNNLIQWVEIHFFNPKRST